MGRSSGLLKCAVLLAVAVLGGCTGRGHSPNKSQVVAKVNDREITTLQLNQAMQTIHPETLTPQITRQALDSLVDEELLVQEALKAKLDRDPSTVAAFEHARRQILAQTFADRRVIPRIAVSLAAEEKYYKDNPALFEHRRLYHLAIYTIKTADMTDLLTADLNKSQSSEQVRGVLLKHGLKYEAQQVDPPAEDLPLGKLDQFANAKVGDLLTAQQADGKMVLISIVDLEDKPLAFERAKPLIAQYLTKQRNTLAIQEHLKAQRAVASISYSGEFAKVSQNDLK